MASKDLTQGPLRAQLISLALPVLGAMILQSLFAIIDLAFVARLGAEAVAGLSISLQVFFIVLALGQVLSTTALASISQSYGAGKLEDAWSAFSAFTIISASVGLVTMVLAYVFAAPYVAFFTDDPGVFDQGLRYFKITALTFFTQQLLIVTGYSFRGSGDFVRPMQLMAMSVVANMVLDPLLIFGLGPFPAMGIEGAAWATVMGQCLALVGYGFVLMRAGKDPDALRLRRPVFSAEFVQRIFTRGLPAGLQFLLLSVLLAMVLQSVKPYGALWTSTSGGGFRLLQQTLLPMVAVGSAAAAIAGQCYGAGDLQRVRDVASLAIRTLMVYGLVAALVLTFGGQYFGYVFADTPEGLELAGRYFLWSGLTTFGFSMMFVPMTLLQALGRPIGTMMGAIVRVFILFFCLKFIIPAFGMVPEWIWGFTTLTSLMEGAVALFILRYQLNAVESELAM